MILDFKRRLFASEKGIDLHLIYQRPYEYEDEIEQWAKVKFGFNIENEYGFFFEKCFPSRESRNQYIREILGNSKISIGYKILATLVKNGLFSKIFTTNFDNLVQKVLPDCAEITENNISNHFQILKSPDAPLIFKLHGDFREDWLRNLPDETQKLHNELKVEVINQMKTLNGLVIIGYSGRDHSVIEMFQEVFKEKGVFPYGVYWCARHGKMNEIVEKLLSDAMGNGLKVTIVNIMDFDELMIDLYKQIPIQDEAIEELLYHKTLPRPFYVTEKVNNNHFIVHNFLPILEYPQHFWVINKRTVPFNNWEDLNSFSEKMDRQIILSFFREDKIIAFGDESTIKTHLGIIELEPYSISIGDLKTLSRGVGFLFGIYHRIFQYHFETFMRLHSIDKHTAVDKERGIQKNDIKFYHALRYYLKVIQEKLYLVIQPDYFVIDKEHDKKAAKNALLGSFKNNHFFGHLWMWQKRLKRFGNGRNIYIYGPPGKTVRFVIGSKFMKSQEVLSNE